MGVETVFLALLGVVVVWLVVDAGRERHRLRARMERAAVRSADAVEKSLPSTPARTARTALSTGADSDAWRYWPLTVSTSEDGSVGPRM